MKILILSCSTGGGHNTCANYILEELKSNNIECIFKDYYDIVNEKNKAFAEELYLKSLGANGNIFKTIYKLGEIYSSTHIKSPVYLVNKGYSKKLFEYIKSNNITLVICTHVFPAECLTAINKKEKVPFIMVATDYECCPFMEETQPNYYVGQKGLLERFTRKKINKDKVILTGIPISKRFINEKKNILNVLNIKTKNTVLITLGSMGFGSIKDVIEGLTNIEDTSIIVVCGNNKNLKKELSKIKKDNLIVLGFVSNMNDLIYSSTIVLSKPGGLSTTEVGAINKPLIHIFPIPGIETYNANFFEKNKMSLIAKNKSDIINLTKMLLENKDLQEEMILNQKKIINKDSAKDLVDFIINNFK